MAMNCAVSPARLTDWLGGITLKEISTRPDGAVSTVTVASAEMTLPSDAVANAVTVVCPIPTPATSPVEFTVAT